jgi:hypothetical protein
MKRLEMREGDLSAQNLTHGSAKRARTVGRPLSQAKHRLNGAPPVAPRPGQIAEWRVLELLSMAGLDRV